MIRFWCAYCTAEHTVRNSGRRSRTVSRLRVAIFVDGRAGNEVHHKVRLTFGGRAAIQKLGDVGVVEVGQNLAFGFESFYGGVRRADRS